MTVLFSIYRAARRAGLVLDEMLADSGLTASDYALYSLLHLEAPMSVTDVAVRTGAPLTTVSQQLKRAERRGHLDRRPNPQDARGVLISLSDLGDAAHDLALPAFRKLLDEVHEALGTDLEQVDYSLRRLNEVLDAAAGGEPVSTAERPTAKRARSVAYTGDPLDDGQEREVRRYIDWVRARDG